MIWCDTYVSGLHAVIVYCFFAVDLKTYNALISSIASQRGSVDDKWSRVLVCYLFYLSTKSLVCGMPHKFTPTVFCHNLHNHWDFGSQAFHSSTINTIFTQGCYGQRIDTPTYTVITCYFAQTSDAMLSHPSVCTSVMFWYHHHIGWNTLKVIPRPNSLW